MAMDNIRQLSITAYHEAGHAVAARSLAMPVESVEISTTPCPQGHADHVDGHTYVRVHDRDKFDIWRTAIMLLTGPMAEERHSGDVQAGGLDDVVDAVAAIEKHLLGLPHETDICMSLMVMSFREWIKKPPHTNLGPLTKTQRTEFNRIWRGAVRDAEMYISDDYWDQIERVAAALLEHRKLHQNDIDALRIRTRDPRR
jgi:hypothetical protein